MLFGGLDTPLRALWSPPRCVDFTLAFETDSIPFSYKTDMETNCISLLNEQNITV